MFSLLPCGLKHTSFFELYNRPSAGPVVTSSNESIRGNESLRIKVGNRELKEVDHFKYIGSVLLHKGNQDENYHGQRNILKNSITFDKQAKF
jgi:hypothetical protein